MNYLIRILIGLAFLITGACGWWLSGFNFDERGGRMVSCFVMLVLCFIAGISCPLLDKNTTN